MRKDEEEAEVEEEIAGRGGGRRGRGGGRRGRGKRRKKRA